MLQKLYSKFDTLQDAALLFLRLILAYGFYDPAMKKVQNIGDIISWFQSLGIPMPTLNAYLATATELSGVILLTLGLFSRIIAIPLMITMIVAISTVHACNGFAASNNGFEIPLYYLIMLFSIMAFGSGKYSVDYILYKQNKLSAY